jgi:hypothetical protein
MAGQIVWDSAFTIVRVRWPGPGFGVGAAGLVAVADGGVDVGGNVDVEGGADVGAEGRMDVGADAAPVAVGGEAVIELDDTAEDGDGWGGFASEAGEPPPHPESARIATTAKVRRRAITSSLRT